MASLRAEVTYRIEAETLAAKERDEAKRLLAMSRDMNNANAAQATAARAELAQARREWDEAHAFIAKQTKEIERLTCMVELQREESDRAAVGAADALHLALAEVDALKERVAAYVHEHGADCQTSQNTLVEATFRWKAATESLRALLGEVRHCVSHSRAADGEWCPRHWVDEDCGEDGSICTCGLDDLLQRISEAVAP